MEVEHWTDWSPRGHDFRQVIEYDDGRPAIAMEHVPAGDCDPEEWSRLRDIWLDLPLHASALEALEAESDRLLLRYAALDWQRPATTSHPDLATWGAQVTELFQVIADEVPHQHLPALLRPFVKIDVGEHARVGFRPVLAEDRVSTWDERSLVLAVGRAMRELRGPSRAKGPIEAILDRATDPTPRKRYRSLSALRKAWRAVGAGDVVRTTEDVVVWRSVEEGFGWLAIGRPQRAIESFEHALTSARAINLTSPIALTGRAHARAVIEARKPRDPPPLVGTPWTPPKPRAYTPPPPEAPPHADWAEIREQAAGHEANRAFREALALYRTVRLDQKHGATTLTAIARCELATGAAGIAVDFAQRAIAFEPRHLEAHSLLARAWCAHGDAAKGLAAADAWLALAPTDAGAHYARGRALMMLARYIDAQSAFERASTLDPALVEAMMLRREAERSAARVRGEVGSQPEIKIELPASLEHLAPLLAAGRYDDVAQLLERPERSRDPEANLVRARCLVFAKRFDAAIEAFDRVIELSPDLANAATLGKAYALLDAGRAADALRLFDTMTFDLEALEGRALALQALGRTEDADATMRQVIAARGGRAELRVRNARSGT